MPNRVHALEDNLALHRNRRPTVPRPDLRAEPRNPDQPRRKAAKVIRNTGQVVRLAGRERLDRIEIRVLNAALDADSRMTADRSIHASAQKFGERGNHAAVAVLVPGTGRVEPGAVQPAFAQQPNRIEALAVKHRFVLRAAQKKESVLRIA